MKLPFFQNLIWSFFFNLASPTHFRFKAEIILFFSSINLSNLKLCMFCIVTLTFHHFVWFSLISEIYYNEYNTYVRIFPAFCSTSSNWKKSFDFLMSFLIWFLFFCLCEKLGLKIAQRFSRVRMGAKFRFVEIAPFLTVRQFRLLARKVSCQNHSAVYKI